LIVVYGVIGRLFPTRVWMKRGILAFPLEGLPYDFVPYGILDFVQNAASVRLTLQQQ